MKNDWIRWVAAAAVLAVLTGCTAALVGGAAAGGYYVGKDERSAKQIASDAAITSSVKTKLITDPAVKALDVNVDTRNSVVILRGRVAKADQRVAAERIARTAKGVKGVRNELRVEGK
jgi:hyperosmotically inducible periplasmic protein